MQPLNETKPDRQPEIWAPEPLQIPAPNPYEHRDEHSDVPAQEPEKPLGSHVIVIDIS